MNRNKIIVIFILFVLTTIVPLLFVYATFTNSINCDQLVIDTYELHSQIDIPEVEFVTCYYDEALNTRISVYDLKESFDLNQFDLIKSPFSNYFQGSSLLSETEPPTDSDIYLRSGER